MSVVLSQPVNPRRLANPAAVPANGMRDEVVALPLPRQTVTSRAYNALSSGQLKWLVLPDNITQNGYLTILPQRQTSPGEPPAQLVQIGPKEDGCAYALEAGHGLYRVQCLAATRPVEHGQPGRPVQAFVRAALMDKGYMIVPIGLSLAGGSGSIQPTLSDGATVTLVPQSKQGRRHPMTARQMVVRVMEKSDMPGLQRGMGLVVPVLR